VLLKVQAFNEHDTRFALTPTVRLPAIVWASTSLGAVMEQTRGGPVREGRGRR
jgi:hypothetical protein